jgi:hypothetical protein
MIGVRLTAINEKRVASSLESHLVARKYNTKPRNMLAKEDIILKDKTASIFKILARIAERNGYNGGQVG